MSKNGENRYAGRVALAAWIEMPRIAEAALGFLAGAARLCNASVVVMVLRGRGPDGPAAPMERVTAGGAGNGIFRDQSPR